MLRLAVDPLLTFGHYMLCQGLFRGPYLANRGRNPHVLKAI